MHLQILEYIEIFRKNIYYITPGKITFLKKIVLMEALCNSFSEKIAIEHSNFPPV